MVLFFTWHTHRMRKVYSFREHLRKIIEFRWFCHQIYSNVKKLILTWIESDHSPSLSVFILFYFFEISFTGKHVENKAPAHEMWSLNGLKFSRVETPLIAPFHSILKPIKTSNMCFVQKSPSQNTTMEIVWIETSLMCFWLTLPGPLFTRRRERHTESSCSGIFGPHSL